MKKTLLALATAFAAFSEALKTAAEELGLTTTDKPAPTPSGDGETPTGEAEPKRRGRPPGSGAAKEEKTEEPSKAKKPDTSALIDEIKTIAQPLIDDGKAVHIKKLIEKHGGGSGAAGKITNIPAENLEAFKTDLEALSI